MRLNLFFLTLLFSFTFSKSNAQCPEGDVQLLSQADVDNFVSTYPNCTNISGILTFGEFNSGFNDISDISGLNNMTTVDGELRIFGTQLTNLNGLNNLIEIGGLNILDNNQLIALSELGNISELNNGQLQIAFNYNLQSLEGLDNIQSISGRLYFGKNDSLYSFSNLSSLNSVGELVFIAGTNVTTLGGLENLQYIGSRIIIGDNQNLENITSLNSVNYVGGNVYISENPQLTSLEGIQNMVISTEGETIGLIFNDNPNLSTCNFPNICEYLSWNSTEYPREISGNTGNCLDEQAVLAACGLGISDVENNTTNWNVAYQKNKGSFLIQSNGFQLAEIEVYDLTGKLIKSVQNLNSNQEELRVFTPENVLIIKVKSKEGKVLAKKVLMK
ncbi:T9SS sorting signal type C domain-containing protein [Moheibacter lacus]|uniref:T9SS sorting signal type C domain-containing protein n=1 Tax=Moheibacter lacus TaxID=2745851 RepID=A0A838ZMW4_9FLAO|nr:T9SS sorting signal type C domain-containing protein [Moheibacter lacus]MBA5629180.1 T9SS sorting signal type C domain-containing protein [Moheibacter lacus]